MISPAGNNIQATPLTTRGPCQIAGGRSVNPFAFMRDITHLFPVGVAATDRHCLLEKNPYRENSEVVRSVIQLVVNGCHEFSYNTRMGIIRNILPSPRL